MNTKFDPQAFLNSSVDQPLAEKYEIIPAGDYPAMIDTFDIDSAFENRSGVSAKGNAYDMNIFNIPLVLQDEELKKKLGRDKVVVRAQCILDIDPNTGQLSTAPGRNVLLGQIRGAVGQNQPGIPFANLAGAGPLMVQIRHRMNPKDPERPFVEVSRAASLR